MDPRFRGDDGVEGFVARLRGSRRSHKNHSRLDARAVGQDSRMTLDPIQSPRAEFRAGIIDSAPMLLGAAPFAVIFGTLATTSGLSPAATLAMSMFVFAGASQFIALTLLAGGAGLAVIAFTTFVVNLRHALYSATLRGHVARLGARWRIPLAFALTDETFAVVQRHYALPGSQEHRHWYYFGSCVAMYVNWVAWTGVGLWIGGAVDGLETLGLEFAMAATFTGIVAPLLKRRPAIAAALAAAVVALAAHALPYKLGLMLAAVAGVAVGAWVESLSRRDLVEGEAA
jgi:4-azaleucine resistance transporter AzlC